MASPWEDYKQIADFGAPGTTATDLAEGTTTEKDVALKPILKSKAPLTPWEDYKAKEEEVSPKKEDPKEQLSLKPPFKDQITREDFKRTQEGLLDIADVAAGSLAYVGAAGIGLAASLFHASDPTKPAGEHFGAGLEVAGAVMDKFGNPIRKAFTEAGLVDKPQPGGEPSPVASVIGNIGTVIKGISKKVGSETASKELEAATEFGLSYLAPIGVGRGSHGLYKEAKVGAQAKDLPKSPEEVDSTVNQWADIHGKTLKEAALRDKQTGEVLPQGPKHDEALKAEEGKASAGTIDALRIDAVKERARILKETYPTDEKIGHTPETEASKYEQGFLDAKGKFLNRKEALVRALQTQQIPPDKKLDFPDEGLHSGDLRDSGVPEFQLEKPSKEKPLDTSTIAKGKFSNLSDKELQQELDKHEKYLKQSHDKYESERDLIDPAIWKQGTHTISKDYKTFDIKKGDKVYTHPQESFFTGKADFFEGRTIHEQDGKFFYFAEDEGVPLGKEFSSLEALLKDTAEGYQGSYMFSKQESLDNAKARKGELLQEVNRRTQIGLPDKTKQEFFIREEAAQETKPNIPHPASIATKEEFHSEGQRILKEYGPEAAKKFAQDVAEYQKKQDVPIPNNEKEAADSLHNLDTKGSADASESMVSIQEMERLGVGSEMRSKFYDYQEGHGKLSPAEKEAYDMTVGKTKEEIKALYDRQVKLGREPTSELHPDFIPRIRLFDPTKTALGTFWERMTRQEGAFADKVGKDPSILEQRNLFVLEGASGKRTVIQKVGKDIYSWEGGKRSGKPIAQGIEDIKTAEFKGKTVKEAHVDELHAHTPYRYTKDAAMVNHIKLNELREFDRASNFIDSWKHSDMFKENATNDNTNIPKGWVTPKDVGRIPQLAGYFFEPKTAWVIEDFAKHFENSMYMKLTSALIKNMMLNPLPHIFNEAMHVFAARGATGVLTPGGMVRFGITGSKAMHDVWNQSQLYRDVMREGGSIMSADLRSNQFHDQMMDKAAKEAFPEIGNIAKKAGMVPLELYQGIIKASNKAMWMTRDAMYLQLIRETQKRNPSLSLKDAIGRVEQHMPNYRVPTTVIGSRKLSTILQNPNVSVFSKYHYGLVNSMAHVVKDMNPKNLGTLEGRAKFRQGLDSALAYSLGMLIMYPLMDQLVQSMFGDETMRQRRAGPFHLLDAVQRVSTGEADTQALLSPIFTFNPVALGGAELLFNRKLYSGRHVYESSDPTGLIARDVGKYMAHAIPQKGAIMDTGDIEGGFIAKQLDIKSKSQAALKREVRAKQILERQRKQRLRKYEKESQ